jgi:hypothetical protein
MGNYSLTNLFTKEPAVIAGAIRTVLMALVLLSLVAMDEKQLAGIALALEVVLTLFVRSQSTSTAEPKLPEGTPVLNPATPGGDSPPPDLIVANKANVITPTPPDPFQYPGAATVTIPPP